MKALVLGSSGLLGKALIPEWTGDEVIGLNSRDMDIRDADRVRNIVESARPEWIVLAAAYTNVDDCESHPDLAFAVNRDGAVNVARAAKSAGARLLFLSSDYVFDGKKNFSLRNRRCTQPAERLRTIQSRSRDSFARGPAPMLHR